MTILYSAWSIPCRRAVSAPRIRICSASALTELRTQQSSATSLRIQTFAAKAGKAGRSLAKPAPYDTPANKFAKQPSTLLYRVESNMPYMVGCYFIGIGLVTCGIFNHGTKNLAMAADVPAYVPLFTAIGSFAMIAAGCWVCTRPQSMIKSVRTIPTTKNGSPSILLQIERSPSSPIIIPATVTVPYTDITTSEPLFLGGEQQIKAELAQLQRKEDRRIAFDRDSIMTLPFRKAGWYTSTFFRGVKKAFTDEGLLKFHVRGKNFAWKMERNAAWAHENGRSLDSLVRIKHV